MESPVAPLIRAPESLADQVRSAIIWRSGSQILAQLVQWAATFMVIRILAPSDYGLFAMTQVVVLLLNMLNGHGLATALIRQPDVTDRQIRQMFGMMVLVNVGLAAIQLILAPVAAAYYHQPIVGQMLQVQALIYVTSPFIALASALLSRSMDFRGQARANILSSIASASAALIGALCGLGVWTLVIAPIVMFAVRAAGLTAVARSLMWPVFDFRGAGQLARYGSLMAVGQLLWFVESQMDVFIAGRSLNPHWLGIYTTSLFLTQIFVSKVVPPLNEVAFSAYARMQDDAGAIAAAFARSLRVIMTAALPFYIGLAVTAEPLVMTMLGPKWVEAVPVVQILACAMPMLTMQVLFAPACDAIGRPEIGVRNGATGAVLLISAYLVGIQWGVMGLAWSWLAAYPVYLSISLWRTLPVIGVSAPAVFASLRAPLVAALAMGCAVMLIDTALPIAQPGLRLAALVTFGGGVYVGSLVLFARPLVDDIVTIVRRRPTSS